MMDTTPTEPTGQTLLRALTDAEAEWVRIKHPEMSAAEQDALIAQGLPADLEPITRDDIRHVARAAEQARIDAENAPQKTFTRKVWDQRRRKRKIAAKTRARARR